MLAGVGTMGLWIACSLNRGCMLLMKKVKNSSYVKQLRASCALPHINLTGGLGSKHYYHKVTDKEIEAWGGEAGLPVSGAISEFAQYFMNSL